jgi:Uma2 family endonuclease
MTTIEKPNPPARAEDELEPTWDIAHLFPAQGTWTEAEYLAMNANRLLEFSHGYLEVLTMPTQTHQVIVLYLCRVLLAFTEVRKPGMALVAPLRVRLWPGKFREPDVVFMLAEHAARRHNDYWEGADLVMEVISDDDRRRDTEKKRFEYARAGIPEYWLVDPAHETITVLRLEESRYVTHGEFGRGSQARSALLPEFSVEVGSVFDSAK